MNAKDFKLVDLKNSYFGITTVDVTLEDFLRRRLETSAKLLDVDSTNIKPFFVDDAFNLGNTIAGHICSRRGTRFGSLVIHVVNGDITDPQPIFCTPKLKYPFNVQADGTRIYKWPDTPKRVLAYEKLDGTNVLGYGYIDIKGESFVTFKTRLTAVCQESEFGPFQSMWKEILVKYPSIQTNTLLKNRLYTLSFELYGAANPILINYDFNLRTTFLFAVRQKDLKVFPHIHIPDGHDLDIDNLDPELIELPVFCIDDLDDTTLQDCYEELRDNAEARNTTSDDGMINGIEGYVLYVEDKTGHFHMYKCKPSCVEVIHWENDTIPLNIIITEIWKVLETCSLEDLDKETVVERLNEEFTKQEIISSHKRIDKAISAVVTKALMMRKMRKAFEEMPLEIRESKDKGTIMRYLSPQFEKSQMRKVYTALAIQGLIE